MEMHEANPLVGKPSNTGPEIMNNPGPSLAMFPVRSNGLLKRLVGVFAKV